MVHLPSYSVQCFLSVAEASIVGASVVEASVARASIAETCWLEVHLDLILLSLSCLSSPSPFAA